MYIITYLYKHTCVDSLHLVCTHTNGGMRECMKKDNPTETYLAVHLNLGPRPANPMRACACTHVCRMHAHSQGV